MDNTQVVLFPPLINIDNDINDNNTNKCHVKHNLITE